MKKVVLTDLSQPEYSRLVKSTIEDCICVLNTKINTLATKGELFYGKLNECGLFYFEMDTRAFNLCNISLEENKIYGYICYVHNDIGKKAQHEVEILKNNFKMIYNSDFCGNLLSINGWIVHVKDLKERKIWEENHSPHQPEGWR